MIPPDELTDQPLVRFRAAALRRSVFLAWILVLIITAQAVRVGVFERGRFLFTAGVFVVGLALATAANWNQVLGTAVGGWLAWAWTVVVTLGLGLLAAIPELFGATQPLFSGVVVLTGLVLTPVRHAFVTLLAIFMLGVAALTSGQATSADLVIPSLTVGVVGAATALLGIEFEREANRSRARLDELRRQRVDFERLYAVSATLAGADSLSEGLPQIVGTICRYLGAQVGLVFLYQPDGHSLRVMSPMWVNGHTLEIGDIQVRVSAGGIVPQVFRSGRPMLLDRVADNPEQYGVIGELGVSQAMIAPLRVEGYNVGVIVVGDPQDEVFHTDQLEVLASLAAPAALVLSQLGRYEAAAETTKRMQEVAQMKTDFVSVVSHELRTPLTSIIGSLDTVARPELGPEAAKEQISTARRQAGRLQRLIDDLLMVSRIDRQAVPISLESFEVRPLLEEIASTVRGIGRIAVSVEPAGLTVTADHDHLGRVFINLVENAAKYAAGSPVELVARLVRNRVDIDVVDHGLGIPLEERDRVFERFTQLEHSDTRSRGGTGLGLSIVKGLVEAMSGQVGLTETPGGGATFTVSLPPAVPAQASRSA
jgi:signal transduction histidine kinase